MDESLLGRTAILREGMRNADYDGDRTLESVREQLSPGLAGGGPPPSGMIFGGTCFFEIRDIDLFLMKKLQAVEETPKLYSPLDLTCEHTEEGVSLSWSMNPENEALIKNLAGNPLLTLRYQIYRWTTGEDSRPEAIATLPYNRNQYLDTGLSPVGNQYFYSVMTLYEGTVGQQRTLIESEHSEVRSIVCEDRFKLKLIAGRPGSVDIEVAVTRGGVSRSRIFTVAEGESIGGGREAAGMGTVDYSTDLTLLEIRSQEVIREEPVPHPAFNSDGSRTLDPITSEPVFRERMEGRRYTFFSAVCEDVFGRRRTLEQD